MCRTHPTRRLWSARVVNDHAIFAAIHRQTIAVGSSLLGIFNVRRISLEYRNLVGGRVLAPITDASPSRLHDHHVVLGDGAVNLIPLFLQVNIRDSGSD